MTIKYRCTHNANTEDQCWRIASRRVKGRWLCLAHLDTDTPIAEPKLKYGNLGSSSPDPEIRKKYFREYRRNYRIEKPHIGRDYGFSWPVSINIDYRWADIKIWRIGNKSASFDTHTYHCERCCNKIEVRRYHGLGHRVGYQLGSLYYRREYYRVNARHDCLNYSASKLKIINCERCGRLGTEGHTIKSNRILSGPYGDKLCIECYRVMRSFWALHKDYEDLSAAIRNLKYEMRKAGMGTNSPTIHRYALFDIVYGYDKTWWCKTHKEAQNGRTLR